MDVWCYIVGNVYLWRRAMDRIKWNTNLAEDWSRRREVTRTWSMPPWTVSTYVAGNESSKPKLILMQDFCILESVTVYQHFRLTFYLHLWYPEGIGSVFFWNAGVYQLGYMTSYPTTLQSWYLLPCKFNISQCEWVTIFMCVFRCNFIQ